MTEWESDEAVVDGDVTEVIIAEEILIEDVVDAQGGEVIEIVEIEDGFELELVEAEAVALELPVWEATGEGRVDAALDRLHDLVSLPTAEHVEVYEDVHRRLGEALSDLESTG